MNDGVSKTNDALNRLAAAKGRCLALIVEALGKRTRHVRGGMRDVVHVVAIALAGRQHVHRVMDIVVPLRAEAGRFVGM